MGDFSNGVIRSDVIIYYHYYYYFFRDFFQIYSTMRVSAGVTGSTNRPTAQRVGAVGRSDGLESSFAAL